MTDLTELSRKRAEAGRKGGKKGGRAKVPKGFATNRKLASEAGKKSAEKRWGKKT